MAYDYLQWSEIWSVRNALFRFLAILNSKKTDSSPKILNTVILQVKYKVCCLLTFTKFQILKAIISYIDLWKCLERTVYVKKEANLIY